MNDLQRGEIPKNACGRRVYDKPRLRSGGELERNLLGFCSREEGHLGKCSHLVPKAIVKDWRA